MTINVLVYNGPGVSETSLNHTISSLRRILVPNYTVNIVTAATLTTEPWPESCALLVIPGGRDLPYVSALQYAATARIKQYVQNGGNFLGICAGAYFASSRVEWETGTAIEVIGDRDLQFFPGTCKGCAYPGFVYESEAGARKVDVKVVVSEGDSKTYRGIYWNGGGYFEDADKMESSGVRVIARYPDEGAHKRAAAVSCNVGRGKAILWGPHLEYPLDRQPALDAVPLTSGQGSTVQPEELAKMENERWSLMRQTLEFLGLRPPGPSSPVQISTVSAGRFVGTLPMILVSQRDRPHIVPSILGNITAASSASEETQYRVLDDANDTFHVYHDGSGLSSILRDARQRRVSEEGDLVKIPKEIVPFDSGEYPNPSDIPLFSIPVYFDHLFASHRKSHGNEIAGNNWRLGEAMLYSERVTSTQTMFDR